MKDSDNYTDKNLDAGRLVMVIGQSGSGHSTALDCLEDAGFSAIDNLPLALIDQLVALSVETEKKQLAVGADLRTSGFDEKAIERLVGNLRKR
ncbi:MAG: RNase adapter RapZ, partial [Candidatus Puniceispirillaceae bacterium]